MLQPPPRGCVLKHQQPLNFNGALKAAASARLCVETKNGSIFKNKREPAAASARLCVETARGLLFAALEQAAASARLCVETGEP